MDFLVTKPCDAIRHLDGIASEFATTSRFRIHYLRSGPDQGEAVVFLHGNGTSSSCIGSPIGLPLKVR